MISVPDTINASTISGVDNAEQIRYIRLSEMILHFHIPGVCTYRCIFDRELYFFRNFRNMFMYYDRYIRHFFLSISTTIRYQWFRLMFSDIIKVSVFDSNLKSTYNEHMMSTTKLYNISKIFIWNFANPVKVWRCDPFSPLLYP